MATLFGTKPRKNSALSDVTLQAAGKAKPSQEELHRAIQQRAEEIYLARNGNPGDPLSDWLKAEKEIKNKFNV